MSTKIVAVNLPVEDLAASTRFFTELGFPTDKRLANETIEAFIISDDIYVLLVDQAQFKTMTKKEIRSRIPPPRTRRSCSCTPPAGNTPTNSPTGPWRKVPCPRMSSLAARLPDDTPPWSHATPHRPRCWAWSIEIRRAAHIWRICVQEPTLGSLAEGTKNRR
jgi:catechol 2,3-dioxygenase-like lactoylglutathione lyase family enzyme